eukprot:scaffold1313_cov250-Pinguiococcus_pyrenoidosus.AAC.14
MPSSNIPADLPSRGRRTPLSVEKKPLGEGFELRAQDDAASLLRSNASCTKGLCVTGLPQSTIRSSRAVPAQVEAGEGAFCPSADDSAAAPAQAPTPTGHRGVWEGGRVIQRACWSQHRDAMHDPKKSAANWRQP